MEIPPNSIAPREHVLRYVNLGAGFRAPCPLPCEFKLPYLSIDDKMYLDGSAVLMEHLEKPHPGYYHSVTGFHPQEFGIIHPLECMQTMTGILGAPPPKHPTDPRHALFCALHEKLLRDRLLLAKCFAERAKYAKEEAAAAARDVAKLAEELAADCDAKVAEYEAIKREVVALRKH